MAHNDAIITALKGLVQLCRDGQNGFRESAEKLSDPSARSYFLEKSTERARFAAELENEVHRLGEGDTKTEGSIPGALHRGWINLKSALGGGDGAILAEAERGEDIAKEAYEKAIGNDDLPQNIRAVIERQFMSVKEAHDRVKQMRDSRKAA